MNMQIKTAAEDKNIFLALSTEEGWNPGLEDPSLFRLIDPSGFFVGYIEDEPIACISNVKYSKNSSFLGLFIVRKEYRVRGYGKKIWLHALNYGKNCNIGLDSVVNQEKFYQSYGFNSFHFNRRYKLDPDEVNVEHTDPNILQTSSIPFALIAEYDKAFTVGDRSQFLRSWISSYNCYSIAYSRDNIILGYGVIRKSIIGYKIGPLFSNDQHIAKILFQHLCQSIEKDQPIFMDIPEINFEAISLVNELKMQPVFETIRMYTKELPNLSFDRTYGVTALEIG